MMKNMTLGLTLLLSAGTVFAQTSKPTESSWSLFQRVDFIEGSSQPAYSSGILTGKWELYYLAWNTRQQEVNLGGQLYRLSKQLVLNGYLTEYPKTGQLFMLPWLSYRDVLGSTKLSIDVAEYLPLNGGKYILYIPEASARWPVTSGLDFGVVASVTQVSDGPAPIRLGFTSRFRSGDYNFKLNIQPWSIHGEAPARVRFQVIKAF
jgi:hypothetical protein